MTMIHALILSVILLIALGAPVLLVCRRSVRLKLMLLTVVAMLAVLCLRLPLFVDAGASVPAALVQSAAHALQAVTLSEDMDSPVDDGVELLEKEMIAQPSNGDDEPKLTPTQVLIVNLYRIYSVMLSLLTPILGGAMLLEALAAFFPYLRLRFPSRRPMFVFSRVNLQAVTLAGSILEEIPARIVFQQTDTAHEDVPRSLLHRVKDMGAIQLSGEAPLRRISAWVRGVNYMFIDSDEQENIKDLARMLSYPAEKGRLRSRRRVRYYAFAHSREAERTVDELARKKVTDGSVNQIVCLLNVQENVAEYILDKHPLHEYAALRPDGRRELNILVVGSDVLAEHFFANAYPVGQMYETELSVTLTAPDAEDFAQRLYVDAPMLRDKENPAVRMCGEVSFIPMGEEVEPSLLEKAHYILVSLGSDAKNVEMAGKIRRAIDRQKLISPERAAQRTAVLFVQEDDALHTLYEERLKPHSLPQGKGCEIIPVGSRMQEYSAQVLFCEQRMFQGFFVDRAYAEKFEEVSDAELEKAYTALMNKAYDRRSSVAAAMQIGYRQHFMQEAEKAGMPGDKILAALTQAEHQRWTAYIILEGYRAPTGEELERFAFKAGFKHKLDPLMLHPCLVESRCSEPLRLWEGNSPADALDELSLQLHELALRELEGLLGRDAVRRAASWALKEAQEKTLEPISAVKDALKTMVKSNRRLSQRDQERALALIQSPLYRDYKDTDRNIISRTEWIVSSAEQKSPLLHSIWKG